MSQSLLKWPKVTNTITTATTNTTSAAPTTTSNGMIMSPTHCELENDLEVLSDSDTVTNPPVTSMMLPPSPGSTNGSDLEDLVLGDSATGADPGNSSALKDDVSTAQDLVCPSGLPLSPAVQPAAAATIIGVHLPSQPYQPKMNYPKQVFGKQQRSLSMAWYEPVSYTHLTLPTKA